VTRRVWPDPLIFQFRFRVLKQCLKILRLPVTILLVSRASAERMHLCSIIVFMHRRQQI